MGQRTEWKVGKTATTNATPTNATNVAITVPTNATGFLAFDISARRDSDGSVKHFNFKTRIKRGGAGASIIGVDLALLTAGGDAAMAACLAASVASGNDVMPQLTGIAGTNITWLVEVRGAISEE